MDRKRVTSSNLTSIGYDSASQTLEVEFQNGSIYQYYNVTPAIFEAFDRAPSKGQFFNSQIKDSFPFARTG
jgi:KTSC domain